MGEVGLEDLIDGLSSPDAYPQQVDDVQILQTHISVLFFAGEHVYKLKKPVELAFLDYTSAEDRKHYCEEEVRLNRRTSPRMYLGVLPVTREGDGRIVIDGGGEPVDWVVEMQRLPKDRMLDALLEKGALEQGQLEEIARVLAKFHERAPTGPSVNRFALGPAVDRMVEENIEQLGRVSSRSAGVVPEIGLRFLRDRARAFLEEARDLMERRVAQWRIREGHGDLHAGNICLVRGKVFVYDCVEFDRSLRCGDVASDLAFLAMDLDHKGFPQASDDVVREYARVAADQDLERLVAFYKIHRALVRAKVQLVTAEDESLEDGQRRGARHEARRYGHLAVGYELGPALILTCGLPGTGKSHAAAYLAGRLRARLLRSEPQRKQTGRRGEVPRGNGRYASERREAVYRAMLGRAVEALEAGDSAVVDATFSRRSLRRPFFEAAARLGVPCHVLALEVPESVARERLELRRADREDPSDADGEVVVEAKADFEAPTELARDRVLWGSGTVAPEQHCEALQAHLIASQEG